MSFDTLTFDQPSVVRGKFYAIAVFDNGLGVHVHPDFEDPTQFHVSAIRGSRNYWEVDHARNNALDLGPHQPLPVADHVVGEIMSQIEAL